MPIAREACGARRSLRGRRCRPRSSPRRDGPPPKPVADGRRPYGGAAAADLRGRPPRVPDVSRAHADHRVHYPGVGDRPDPRAPPPACRDGGPRRRRAESALDPRTVWTGRHATTRRGPPGPLSRTPTPRSRAGTFGVRVRPSGASDRSPGDRMPTGNAVRTAKETRRRAAGRPLRARRPSRGRRSRRTFAGYSTDPD